MRFARPVNGVLTSRGTARMTAKFTMDASGMRRLEAEEKVRIAAAAREAVERVTKKAERLVETATKMAIPGKHRPSRLYLAWGSQIIHKPGQDFKLFGLIRPNGRRQSRSWKTLESYAKGATIRGRRGQSLAIPTENAGVRYAGRGKIALTPQEWERRTHRKLRLVAPRGKPYALLVADEGQRKRGGKATVIFILVREVNVPKLLNLPDYIRPFRQELKLEFLRLHEAYQKGAFFNTGVR